MVVEEGRRGRHDRQKRLTYMSAVVNNGRYNVFPSGLETVYNLCILIHCRAEQYFVKFKVITSRDNGKEDTCSTTGTKTDISVLYACIIMIK